MQEMAGAQVRDLSYVFQPVIHEPLSKPDHLTQQNGTGGDAVENSDTSHEIPAHTKDSQELDLDRYKFTVQVVIGEQRGEGVKIACRCLWDSDTDNYAQDIFMNDTLFCVVAAYGVFHY